jgi:hypothetical protein
VCCDRDVRPLVLTLALSLLHAAPLAAVTVGVVDERPLVAGQAFHLRVEAGSVQLRPGAAGQVRVEADLAPGQRVLWRESADRAVVVIDDSERFSARPSALRVAVPTAARLVLHLGRAALDVQGVAAERLVVRGGAEVRVAGDFGDVDLAVDGPVDLRLDGAADAVRAEGSEIRLTARGTVGSIAVDARRGPATLALDVARRVRVATVSAPISLRLGEASGADVLLDSLSGDLRVDLAGTWPGVIVPRLGRGDIEIPAVIASRVVPSADAGGEGGRLVLRSPFGNARLSAIAAPPPSAEPGEAEPPE